MSAIVSVSETMMEFGGWEVLGFNPPGSQENGQSVIAISFFNSSIDYVDGTSEESYQFTQSAATPYAKTGIDMSSCEQDKIAWNLWGVPLPVAISEYTLQQVSYDPSTQTTVFNVLCSETGNAIHVPRPFSLLFSYMKTPPNVYAPPSGTTVFVRTITEASFNPPSSASYGPYTFIGGPNNDGYYFSKISNYSFNRNIEDYFNGT